MRIEPQANNAIKITLADGYSYDINTSEHGGHSYLYIKPYIILGYALEIAQIDASTPGGWEPLAGPPLPCFIRLHTVRRHDV